MKKIILSSLVVFMGISNAIAGTCNVKIPLEKQGTDDDFLFVSETDWKAGLGFKCDKTSASLCFNGDFLVMPAGHYFNGKPLEKVITYKCSTGVLNDNWVKVSEGEYTGVSKPKFETANNCKSPVFIDTDSDANEYLYFSKKDKEKGIGFHCDKDVSYSFGCTNGKEVFAPAGHCFEGDCGLGARCYKCHVNDGGDYWKTDCGGNKTKTVKANPDACPVTNSNCKTPVCSDWAKVGEAAVYCCRNKLKNGNNWKQDVGTGECMCEDTVNYEWIWDAKSKTASCVLRKQPEEIVSERCLYTLRIAIECPNGNYIAKGEKIPVDGKDCDGIKKMLDTDEQKVIDLASEFCGNENYLSGKPDADSSLNENGQNSDNGINQADVQKAQEHLMALFAKVDSDRSVWKNADGSFNGARLASDLTAGVILGTVGGVVSGVLIKKSQVEKGFDALNCSVGGQKIADWGDEFTVGLRR